MDNLNENRRKIKHQVIRGILKKALEQRRLKTLIWEDNDNDGKHDDEFFPQRGCINLLFSGYGYNEIQLPTLPPNSVFTLIA